MIALRYRNVILGGIFAGLAGAWLTLEFNASFQNGMTANRGFIALAAVIFGRWTPIGAFGGALLFMFSEALGVAIRSDPPPGDLGVWLSGIQASYPSLYNNSFSALPYILTIIVLAGVVGRSVAARRGRPAVRQGRRALSDADDRARRTHRVPRSRRGPRPGPDGGRRGDRGRPPHVPPHRGHRRILEAGPAVVRGLPVRCSTTATTACR